MLCQFKLLFVSSWPLLEAIQYRGCRYPVHPQSDPDYLEDTSTVKSKEVKELFFMPMTKLFQLVQRSNH